LAFSVTSPAGLAIDDAHAGEGTNRKRGEQYLAASSAVPISVTQRGTIHTGTKITGSVAARWWINERDCSASNQRCSSARWRLNP
jgi:hypothetical protein